MSLLIQHALVVGPQGVSPADVLVADGQVVSIEPDISPDQSDSVIDARGAWLGPGFVDLHVHFREPGHEWKEDIATGSAAAASGRLHHGRGDAEHRPGH